MDEVVRKPRHVFSTWHLQLQISDVHGMNCLQDCLSLLSESRAYPSASILILLGQVGNAPFPSKALEVSPPEDNLNPLPQSSCPPCSDRPEDKGLLPMRFKKPLTAPAWALAFHTNLAKLAQEFVALFLPDRASGFAMPEKHVGIAIIITMILIITVKKC